MSRANSSSITSLPLCERVDSMSMMSGMFDEELAKRKSGLTSEGILAVGRVRVETLT